jgi:hypothetical protein
MEGHGVVLARAITAALGDYTLGAGIGWIWRGFFPKKPALHIPGRSGTGDTCGATDARQVYGYPGEGMKTGGGSDGWGQSFMSCDRAMCRFRIRSTFALDMDVPMTLISKLFLAPADPVSAADCRSLAAEPVVRGADSIVEIDGEGVHIDLDGGN